MARETLPDADEPSGEMDIIRERLDGQPLAGWRATLATWLERAGAWFGAPSSPAPSVAPAAGVSERRLTGRQKLTRGALVILAVALTLFTLLGGPDATLGALNATLFPPPATPTISASEYALERLPPSAQHLPRIALAPAVAEPGSAFACWVNPYKNTPLGLAMVYQTADFAHTWRRLDFPLTEAVDCEVVTDTTGSAGALVITTPGYVDGLCQPPRLFHTLDDGATWVSVPWVAPNNAAPCYIRYALNGDAIFAWSVQPLIASAFPSQATGRLIVTRDNGATWATADSGLSDDTGLALVGFRAGGRILATTPDVSGPPGAAMLMESRDYGATWRDLGDLPGAFPIIYATTDPSVKGGSGWGRLYLLARPLISGAPADASRIILATATTNSKWSPIPLPPLTANDNSDVYSALPEVLGVGPAGALFVERGAIPTNIESHLSPARRLWAWSVSQRRWLLDPQPSLADANLLGWSWSHGDQTVWVTSLQLGVPPTLLLFTKTFTAASLGPAS